MIEIKPIEPFQIAEAKRLMICVAEGIYRWGKPVDELIAKFDAEGYFQDMDNVQAHYFARRGTFLGAFDEGRLIGMGAIRVIDEKMCELKRMWLLQEYHGKGIGYRVLTHLLDFARRTGYECVRLETGRQQERAIQFYTRQGFKIVPSAEDLDDDLMMEMVL